MRCQTSDVRGRCGLFIFFLISAIAAAGWWWLQSRETNDPQEFRRQQLAHFRQLENRLKQRQAVVPADQTPQSTPSVPDSRPATTARTGNLATGIQLSARPGVLPDTVRGEVLDMASCLAEEERLDPYSRVLGFVRIDCGLPEDAPIPGGLIVEFDAAALGIPVGLHDALEVLHRDESGKIHPLFIERRNGGHLVCRVRHNGFFLIRVSLLLYALGRTVEHAWETDRAEIPRGEYACLPWRPDGIRCFLRWPRDWPSAAPDEVDALQKQLETLFTRYQVHPDRRREDPVDPSSSFRRSEQGSGPAGLAAAVEERNRRLTALFADPDFRKCRSRLQDAAWLRTKLLPSRVGEVATAFDRAWDYLCAPGVRGFRKPGIARFDFPLDAYVLNEPLGPDTLAEARNCWTESPWLVFDASRIGGDPKTRDMLQATTVHELFHAIQSSYSFYESNDYLWFQEATAVTLETEAKAWYLKQGYVANWDDKLRPLDAYFDPLDYKLAAGEKGEADAQARREHGYGAAEFIEHLRDRRFRGRESAFLTDLYEQFAGLGTGPLDALQATCGMDAKALGREFSEFILAEPSRFLSQRPKAALTPEHRRLDMGDAESRPLSIAGLKLTPLIPSGLKPDTLAEAKLVVSTAGDRGRGADIRLRLRGGWVDPGPLVAYGLSDPETPDPFQILRVEGYRDARETQAGPPTGSEVFLLLRPPAPKFRLQGENVQVLCDGSALARSGRGGSVSCLSGFVLHFRAKGLPREFSVFLPVGPDGNGFRRFPRPDFLPVGQQGPGEIVWELAYRESADGDGKIVGPESPMASLSLPLPLPKGNGVTGPGNAPVEIWRVMTVSGGSAAGGWLPPQGRLKAEKGPSQSVEGFTCIRRDKKDGCDLKAGVSFSGRIKDTKAAVVTGAQELADSMAGGKVSWKPKVSAGSVSLGLFRGSFAEAVAEKAGERGWGMHCDWWYEASLVCGNASFYLNAHVSVSADRPEHDGKAKEHFNRLRGEAMGAISGLNIQLEK